MDDFHRAAWELIRICREAVDNEVFGGKAPSDSNALSEIWPTREGAALTGEHDGQKYVIAVLPDNREPELRAQTYPDYSVLDA